MFDYISYFYFTYFLSYFLLFHKAATSNFIPLSLNLDTFYPLDSMKINMAL